MIKETDRRFRFLSEKIVIFTVSIILGMGLILYFTAKERGVFQKTEEVYFITETATGLYTGMPVKVSGFKIGRLKDMKLLEDARVRATLSIVKDEMRWLKEGSIALLTKEGLIGESIIEIIPGSGPLLSSQREITFVKTKGMDEMADELRVKVEEILDGVKKTLEYMNSPEGDLKKTLKNLERLTSELRETAGRMDTLLVDLTKRVNSIGEETESALKEAEKRIRELEPVVKSLRDSMDSLKEASSTLKDSINSSSGEVSRALRSLNRNLEDTEDILKSIKGMWPVRTGIKKEEIKIIEKDTYER